MQHGFQRVRLSIGKVRPLRLGQDVFPSVVQQIILEELLFEFAQTLQCPLESRAVVILPTLF